MIKKIVYSIVYFNFQPKEDEMITEGESMMTTLSCWVIVGKKILLDFGKKVCGRAHSKLILCSMDEVTQS